MRNLTILIVGSLALSGAACASNNRPPAASSSTVAQASDERNRGPNFEPASNDGLVAAQASDSSQTSGPWDTAAEGSSRLSPTARNAAATPLEHQPDADNSSVDRRDRSSTTLSAMGQSQSAVDRKITRDIRQAVLNDSTLSPRAKNVKIITIDGRVTLRGPVKTEAERTAIEATARRVVGSGALVHSELELIQ